jgi:hypothetical protein
MKPTNKRKPTHRKLTLFYLALSGATSAFWTWMLYHLLSDLPLWGYIGIFLMLLSFTFGLFACFIVGPGTELPALREDNKPC